MVILNVFEHHQLDKIHYGSNTEKYQDDIVCSYGHTLTCVDEQYRKPDKTYFGKDIVEKSLFDIMDSMKYYCRVIERERRRKKPLFMTKNKIMY